MKVFSATTFAQRQALGDSITSWLRANPTLEPTAVVRQSSDNSFHCLSIVVFWKRAGSDAGPRR